MRKFLTACCCICIFISCSKKTVPSKPNAVLENNTTTNATTNNPVLADTAAAVTMPADSLAIVAVSNVMIVADGYGKLVTPEENLPDSSGIKYNSLQLSKGFTVQQRANLQARYNTVPPRVLYVPDKLGSTSLKGSYYIYKKKFWYWKKSDGLYYLDQKYYL
jgi:hypothetical protein